MITLIFQSLVFTLYVLNVYKRFGVLPSISDSWYQMNKPAYFTLFCFAIGLPMILHSREFNPAIAQSGDYTIFFYMSMFLAFTGVATDYKEKTANIIHFTGAAVAIISAIVGIALQYHIYWLPVAWLISSIIIILFIKNRIWWVEIFSFILIITALFTLYI